MHKAPTKYLLAPDAYFCRLDEGGVFLDMRSEKYYGVSAASIVALERWIEGMDPTGGHFENSCDKLGIPGNSAAALKTLLDLGLLTESYDVGKSVAPIALSLTDSWLFAEHNATFGCPPLRTISSFLRALTLVWAKLKVGRLNSILHLFLRAKAHHERLNASTLLSDAHIQQLVADFRYLRPWFYVARDKCLFNSLVLATYLYQLQVAPTFVVGVLTKPFIAHAWVQWGSILLDDTPDRVQQFTPILAV